MDNKVSVTPMVDWVYATLDLPTITSVEFYTKFQAEFDLTQSQALEIGTVISLLIDMYEQTRPDKSMSEVHDHIRKSVEMFTEDFE